MVRITLNGKFYQCKTRRSELTCGELEKIHADWDIHNHPADRDYARLVCILCGAEYFAEQNLTPAAQEAIWLAVKDIIGELFDFSNEVPKALTIDGKEIDLQKEVRRHSVGANIVLRQAMDQTKYLQQSLSLACAVYLQPAFDGVEKFSLTSALKLQQKIKAMPAEEVYGTGFFILRRAERSGLSFGHVFCLTLNNLRLKLRTMFLGWPDQGNYCATQIFSG